MRSLLAVLLLVPLAAAAQPEPTAPGLPSDISAVTVFLQGAQVTRTAQATIPAGPSTLRFTGLTAALDPSSLQLSAEGAFTILGVGHRIDYLTSPVASAEVERLQALVAAKEDSLQAERAMLEVYEAERGLLLSNSSQLAGTDGVAVAELAAAADFFRTRLAEISQAQIALERRIERLDEDLTELRRQLRELNASGRGAPTSTVEVTVDARQATAGTFAMTYITRAAGWSPHYDLRVTAVGQPVALTYRAEVMQTTGMVWDDAQLTLSTGNPTQPGTRPTLDPWRLSFYESSLVQKRQVPAAAEARMDQDASLDLDEVVVTAGRPIVQTVVNATTVEFAIEQPYTIAPDGQPTTVVIQTTDVPASYAYFTAPKADPHAYLTARITDWEAFNLLSGEANVFFEGTFVGTSLLDLQSVDDTLVVSLGRDPSVVVSRTKAVDFSERALLGTRVEETVAYTIELRNTKASPVAIEVRDQVPVSTNEQISVRHAIDDGGRLEESTGLVTWRLTLPPRTTETLNFRYTVRYPSGRRVVLE